MTTFGTGRRRGERQARDRTLAGQADPQGGRGKGARPKPRVLTIKAGMSFCFKGIVLVTPPSIKDSDGGAEGRRSTAPSPRKRRCRTHGVRLGPGAEGVEMKAGKFKKTGG
jgi:hypothetical protein